MGCLELNCGFPMAALMCFIQGGLGAAARGGVSWGCPGGAQRSCGDHPHPIQSGLKETQCFEKLAHFPCVHVHGYVVGFWRPSALLATKKASFGNERPCRLAIPLIMGQEITKNLITEKSKISTFLFFLVFLGQKGVLRIKNGVFGCFGPSVREQT